MFCRRRIGCLSIVLIVMQAIYMPQSGHAALFRFRANRQGCCNSSRCTKQPTGQLPQNRTAAPKEVGVKLDIKRAAEAKPVVTQPVEVIPANQQQNDPSSESMPPVPTLDLRANDERPQTLSSSGPSLSPQVEAPATTVARPDLDQILKLNEFAAKIENEFKSVRRQLRKRYDSLEQLQRNLEAKVDRLFETQVMSRAASEASDKFQEAVTQLMHQIEQKSVYHPMPSAPQVMVDPIALNQNRESFRMPAHEAEVELKHMREEKHRSDIILARNDAWLTAALIGIASILGLALLGQIGAANRVASLQRDLLVWQSRYHESIAMRDAAVAHEKTIGAVRESAAHK